MSLSDSDEAMCSPGAPEAEPPNIDDIIAQREPHCASTGRVLRVVARLPQKIPSISRARADVPPPANVVALRDIPSRCAPPPSPSNARRTPPEACLQSLCDALNTLSYASRSQCLPRTWRDFPHICRGAAHARRLPRGAGCGHDVMCTCTVLQG
ncbi:hypothetical protein HYPSUDRAFT_201385 [Hypholoma sublateritium FD-334 SS-4]|uniref:Uncharacterized protein n=1 Tax=Hypholoma sublateritium (strain FD-334 SS-4) TaxID=945553 RepID=A0A0D2PUT8_HYPSF|nr:hypothetical protein HYPSUDRAFT_201385 [Hypholoma sublateritium FD-334 SS-4]